MSGGGKPVNLRQWRKRHKRDAARADGDANAAKHGQPKPVRRLHDAQAEKAARDLDGHRLDAPALHVPASSRDPDEGASTARGPGSSPGHWEKPDDPTDD